MASCSDKAIFNEETLLGGSCLLAGAFLYALRQGFRFSANEPSKRRRDGGNLQSLPSNLQLLLSPCNPSRHEKIEAKQYRDVYFLKKLLYLKGDDEFQMNQVLVCLWYIMGLWPLVYSMLLLPSGRSSNSRVPVWPFLLFSCFGGAYALLPYFVIWRPPAPAVDKAELQRWPLKFFESKITAVVLGIGGLVLTLSAGLAGAEAWKEFVQYFRESKFIHVMSIDFIILSTLSPFWVYNDMTVRNWFNKGSWLLPVALVPFLGPTLYLILRPSLPSTMVNDEQNR